MSYFSWGTKLRCIINPWQFDDWCCMNAEEFVERLLSHPDIAAQRRFLEEHQSFLDNEVVLMLKEKADHFLRANVHRSFEIAELLYYIAELTYNSLFRANALGLLVEAN